MKLKLLLCLALYVGGGLFFYLDQKSDFRIVCARPFVAPRPNSLPREALFPHGSVPIKNGTFADMMARRISHLTVTWADPKYFRTQGEIQLFLNELLKSPSGIFSYHIWEYGEGDPLLIAVVHYRGIGTGKLFVWVYPDVHWAYLSENGTWWWSENARLKTPAP